MTQVFVRDIRTARICFQGARPWFARHGFSWRDFLANGIEAERLETTGDALAYRVTAQARAREACEVGEVRKTCEVRCE